MVGAAYERLYTLARVTASARKSREQQQPRIAVGLEDPQAQRRMADVIAGSARRMRGEGDQA